MAKERDLGMDRDITRRDFLNGVGIALTGSMVSPGWLGALGPPGRGSGPAQQGGYYPPALMGLRGSHPGSFEVGHTLRDGAFPAFPDIEVDTRESYDLVVVGGGISGLSAAIFFRRAFGEDKSVLVLDNHDDIGGHAKRNEFTHEGRTFIGYGGTMGISTPFPYSYTARSLIEDIGIQVQRYPEFVDQDLYDRHGLSRGVFFDRETFGEDRLVPEYPGGRGGEGAPGWSDWLAGTPLSREVRRDVARLYDDEAARDHMPDLSQEEKRARLAKTSYQEYLLEVVGVTPEAIPFLRIQYFRNNKKLDTCPALEAAESGAPGFAGLGLDEAPRLEWDSYYFHFPDGGATVPRLMVKKLVPGALPGELDMEDSIRARMDYGRLDQRGAPVRIRLNSTAVGVEHEGDPDVADWVRVAYVKDGRVHGVRARNCVLACWNEVIPYLARELPEGQKEALVSPVKVPMEYTNVFVRNWKPWVELGVSRVSFPGMLYPTVNLDVPVSMGGYRCSRTPEEPIIIHLSRSPGQPGLPRRQQQRAGMRQMLTTSFEEIELNIRDQLARALGPGGFDPAEDILGITVNRWPHGYAYTPDTLGDDLDVPEHELPHVIGRRAFGRIAIANADAGAAAYINVAIDQAHRAVRDLIRTREPY